MAKVRRLEFQLIKELARPARRWWWLTVYFFVLIYWIIRSDAGFAG